MKKQITKVNKCYGKFSEFEGDKVFVIFNNRTSSLRKIYKFKKRRLQVIMHDYTTYKINWNPLKDSYDFEPLNEEEKKDFEDDFTPKKKDIEEVLEEVLEDGYTTFDKDARHTKELMIETCIEQDIPVYLAGPAGSGKNHIIQKIARRIGLDFYFTNSVQQEYKITGFIDAGGIFHETEFFKAFTNGGLFFLDEIDASIPEVLVLLNAAIANKYFEFPTGKVDAHEDFRVIAAGNTVGSGADELYVGRMVLDSATLDRFAIIPFDYERQLELGIANGNAHLVDFIRSIRRIAKENGIRATFSYRAIMMVRDLEKSDVSMVDILKIAVFKGMQKDDIACFQLYDDSNKYNKALRQLQRD